MTKPQVKHHEDSVVYAERGAHAYSCCVYDAGVRYQLRSFTVREDVERMAARCEYGVHYVEDE